MRLRLSVSVLAAACAAAAALSTPAAAQSFPTKQINLIVPFPPAGAGDIIGRVIAAEMQQRLGKPVIVLNKPGGGTAIAAREVASSPPDGYTILSGSNSTFVFPHAVRNDLPYDSIKEFEPIGQIAQVALVLSTFADNPVSDLKALVAAAKANPGKLPIASYGAATISHFAGEMFKASAAIDMTHVAYKGSSPAMNDLVGKHVAYLVDTSVATKPRVDEGKIRALAIFSGQRSAYMPDVPTFKELGYPAIDLTAWLALALPKGVPADIRAKLMSAVEESLKSATVHEKLSKLGFEPGFVRIDDWQGRLGKEIGAMKQIAEKAGIKADD